MRISDFNFNFKKDLKDFLEHYKDIYSPSTLTINFWQDKEYQFVLQYGNEKCGRNRIQHRNIYCPNKKEIIETTRVVPTKLKDMIYGEVKRIIKVKQ